MKFLLCVIYLCVYILRLYTPEGFCFCYYPRPRGERKRFARNIVEASIERARCLKFLPMDEGIRGTPLSIFVLFSSSFSFLFLFFPPDPSVSSLRTTFRFDTFRGILFFHVSLSLLSSPISTRLVRPSLLFLSRSRFYSVIRPSSPSRRLLPRVRISSLLVVFHRFHPDICIYVPSFISTAGHLDATVREERRKPGG